MWLHESESNSIITEAYENKIFLTIIYISNNSPPMIGLTKLKELDIQVTIAPCSFGNILFTFLWWDMMHMF